MKEYRICLAYKIGEKFNIKAESIEEARAKAIQLAESTLETNEASEVEYEIIGPGDEYKDGYVLG